ncbi:MAG: type II secretion system protein [Candidatus Saccharibacteria bacterium]
MYGQRAGQSETRVRRVADAAGFTLIELVVSMVVISILVVSLFGLFITLVHSATIAKQRAVALTLANNQMEYLKSLPYDSLIVIGGSIVGTGVVQPSVTQTVNNAKYTVKTGITYVDDAYDNCGNIYSTAAQKVQYCRGATTATPTTDTNPDDYKDANVSVYNAGGTKLANVDTQIAARVSETASNTGAFVITVVDGTGTPISGATVTVVNNVVNPHVNASDTTDENGIAIIYAATPDANNDYVITASMSGYSTLSTIAVSGSLQPTYPNQKVIAQQASNLTMKLYPMVANSLVVQTTDTAGNPLANVKVYAKGGYKKFTSLTDYGYYYDNYYSNYNSGTVSDNRLATDSGGLGALSNLVPANSYIFCNSDNTASANTNCAIGSTKYYLAAAVPYGGVNSLQPITVPINDPTNPPSAAYTYGGNQYVQKVQLMLTTSSTFPRVYTINPYQLSLSGGGLGSVLITLTGYNLSSATAKLTEGSNTYTGTGCSSTTTQLKCSFNLSSIAVGTAQLAVTNSAGTLTLPTTPQGGLNVVP